MVLYVYKAKKDMGKYVLVPPEEKADHDKRKNKYELVGQTDLPIKPVA